jgi:uncharacterized repeat protein (TIGR03803 family)
MKFMSLKSVIAFLFITFTTLVGAQTLQTVCSFAGTNGANPHAALALGNDGNFYGITSTGGINSSEGTVFKITTNGTLTALFFFAYTNADPVALTLGDDGNFYGTTTEGGGGFSGQSGTVFMITTNGTFTTLVSFNGTNGANPFAGLTLGPDGKFYGTTQFGGSGGIGSVFQMTTNGTLTTLVSFNGTNGANPYAGLTLGNDGNFYGTTYNAGGANGTIFKITTNGTLTTLVSFYGTNGANPSVALTLGNDGNFYGTTTSGGDYGDGTIFTRIL